MINYNLKDIKAIIFDVDGVLSTQIELLSDNGELIRTANIKDGYAIKKAENKGLKLAIITGGNSEAVKLRYNKLGVEDVYLGCANKIEEYQHFKKKYCLQDFQIMYMGDDMPDLGPMNMAGCPCCPQDACDEIKSISLYVSHKSGGMGCARDIIEQVLKAQDLW